MSYSEKLTTIVDKQRSDVIRDITRWLWSRIARNRYRKWMGMAVVRGHFLLNCIVWGQKRGRYTE